MGSWWIASHLLKQMNFQRLRRSSSETLKENHLQMKAKEAFSGFFSPSPLRTLPLLATRCEFSWKWGKVLNWGGGGLYNVTTYINLQARLVAL